MNSENPMLVECQCCLLKCNPSEICINTCQADPKHNICHDCFTKSGFNQCFYCNPLSNSQNNEVVIEVDINEFNTPCCNYQLLFCYFLVICLGGYFIYNIITVLISKY